jgi:hypothetical protein
MIIEKKRISNKSQHHSTAQSQTSSFSLDIPLNSIEDFVPCFGQNDESKYEGEHHAASE